MVNKAEELADRVSQELLSYDWNRVKAWIRKVDPDKDGSRYTEMLNLTGACPFYGWLACLTKVLQPKKIVEIGADRGTSADFFLSELPEDGKLYSLDIRSGWEYTPSWDNRLIKFVADDLITLREFGEGFKDADIWFVDSSHQPAHVSAVMGLVFPLAKRGAVIINHDVNEFGLTEIIGAYPCDYWQDDRKIFSNGVSLQIV